MRIFNRLRHIAILAALGASPLSAHAEPARIPATRVSDTFENFLASIDVVPPDRAALEKAYPDAWVKLDAAARDDKRDTWTRVRALSLLSYFPEARTRATFEAVATSKDVEIRRHSIYALGRTFGPSADASLVRYIAAFAKDPEPAVGEHAIRSLRWIDIDEARVALLELARHGSPGLRKLAQTTLDKRIERMKSPKRGH